MPKYTYQVSILKKALTEKEFQEFDKKYIKIANCRGYLTPATQKEKEVLESYLKQKLSLVGVSKELNIPLGSAGNKVRTIALKILAEKYNSLKRSKQ